MDNELEAHELEETRLAKEKLQQKISSITVQKCSTLHTFPDVPSDFCPWTSNLSPSALYNCSLPLRKQVKIKTPETKWVSIKRWSTITPSDIELPEGVYYSIKRHEEFLNEPKPHFAKIPYILILLPYGNVYSQSKSDEPLTEEWLFSEFEGKLMLEHLMDKDAVNPINGYFKSVYEYMLKNPEQIGIHLRRKNSKKK